MTSLQYLKRELGALDLLSRKQDAAYKADKELAIKYQGRIHEFESRPFISEENDILSRSLKGSF